MRRLSLLLSLTYLASTLLKADDHWGTIPPVPELQIFHYPAMGVVEISFISDSTFDRPIWYILEVKQEEDPNANWFRPFNPLQGSIFNQRVTLELNYRDAAGQMFSWFKAEMIRIRVMWGA
tara:strand:+ start:9981 stop:10343 length:363 start_codon:yes stop_codon:yes gene_type:complete